MKKTSLLLLSLLALTGCSEATTSQNSVKKKLSIDEVATKFVSFFNGTYSVSSTIVNSYTKETYYAIDSVSSNAKVNAVYDKNGKIITYTSIISENGYAVEEYIDISNNISTRDVSTSKVSFKDNYGSPLSKIMGSTSLLNANFTPSEDGSVYTYTANAQGLSKASASFGSFFKFYGDEWRWDAKTTTETIEDLVITSDESGYPSKLSFTKIKKDKYGGIKETFTSNLVSLSAIPSIQPVISADSEDIKTKLKDSLSLLAEKVSTGNFTQTITHPYLSSFGDYHNYYSFNEYGYGGMLCDIPWYSSEYGTTYIGVGYSSYYGYYMEGVSPESEYTGAASNDYYDSVADLVPQIADMSNEFFTYDETTKEYVFDMDEFYFDDYYFDFSILDCLFGTCDPCADKFAYYLCDTSNYAMDFNSLSIKINETTSLPEFTLVYTDSYSQELTVKTSFSDFGTTDLSTNLNLKDAYELMLEGE